MGEPRNDKRSAAYESIFGRKGHPAQLAGGQDYAPASPVGVAYGYQQPQQYGQYSASYLNAAQPSVNRPHSVYSGHSPISAEQPPVPLPVPYPEPTNNGLTPAQAYQAEVNNNLDNASSPVPPQLFMNIATGGPSLGLDFSAPEPSDLPYVDEEEASFKSALTSSRKSSESSRTVPQPPRHLVGPRDRPNDRSMSLSLQTRPSSLGYSVASSSHPSRAQRMSARTTITASQVFSDSTPSPVPPTPRKSKAPLVYPALLSRVASAFKDRIALGPIVKDDLCYQDAFDGRSAVDKIAYIIKTTDRTLALLLGRALDSQKFFHDVTYDHRLRDSPNEVYQFSTGFGGRGWIGGSGDLGVSIGAATPRVERQQELFGGPTHPTSPNSPSPHVDSASPNHVEEPPLPTGVFTLLTDCYSPTCSRDRICYSIVCPRRLEQQARTSRHAAANTGTGSNVVTPPAPPAGGNENKGIRRTESMESLLDTGATDGDATLWIHTVPPEVVNSVSDKEKRRQEAINEVMYTERDFVRDLEYLRDTWIKRLRESDVIPAERKEVFIEQVFWNVLAIHQTNSKLRDALTKRQKSYAVVEQIGDVLLEHVHNFEPFVEYGAHQLYGKYEFEREKGANAAFAAFVETTERLPVSRKLELNAYLTKPTTRLARYPLLLEAVLKQTEEDNPDRQNLPTVISLVRSFLSRVNAESGKTENRFNLIQLDQQLLFKPGEEVNLRLREEGRELVYKAGLSKRDGEVMVWLFDHALLFAKAGKATKGGPAVGNNGAEVFKVYRRPIPLELLLVHASEDSASSLPPNGRTNGSTNGKSRSTLTRRGSFGSVRDPPSINATTWGLIPDPSAKNQFWIHFVHLGRKYYSLTLWANSALAQKKWMESILKQQDAMRARSRIFERVVLSEGFFAAGGPSIPGASSASVLNGGGGVGGGYGLGGGRVNCAAPYGGGRRVVYGTDEGVYISELNPVGLEEGQKAKDPVKVLELQDVTQVDVLEDYQLLIVLSEKHVITFPLEALDPRDPSAGLRRAKRIASHTSFFKAGYCLGKVLVCIVKSSQLSSTFKTLEPIEKSVRGSAKPTFKKLLQGGNDTLRLYREFYIPVESSSIHYLKTKMCVGCSKGFEIVDLETLDTQGLLDPNDESLEFVRKKDGLKPMAIYRIQNDFLLCYDEFAFYVNRTGKRSRKDFMVYWEGSPTGFALHEPYVLAFEPNFIEIRHIETGNMSQVIQGSNLRLLFADTPPSVQKGSQFGGGYTNQYGQGYYGQPPTRQPQGMGKDEILIVEDDRVMALRPLVHLQQQQQFAPAPPPPHHLQHYPQQQVQYQHHPQQQYMHPQHQQAYYHPPQQQQQYSPYPVQQGYPSPSPHPHHRPQQQHYQGQGGYSAGIPR
ncbi:CNH domain-containing protein [Flagelloscypha sp. PMI_526]|nr:CNH domain-containing protein [Flagelloscypha sp. PMI_526]